MLPPPTPLRCRYSRCSVFLHPEIGWGCLSCKATTSKTQAGGMVQCTMGRKNYRLWRGKITSKHTLANTHRDTHIHKHKDMYVRAVILQRAASGAHSFLLPPHSTPHTAHRTPHTAPHTEHSLSCIHKNTHTRDPCTLLQRAETDTAGRKGHRTVLSTGGTSSPMMVDPHPTPPLSLSLSSLSQSCRTCPTSKNSPHTHHTDR